MVEIKHSFLPNGLLINDSKVNWRVFKWLQGKLKSVPDKWLINLRVSFNLTRASCLVSICVSLAANSCIWEVQNTKVGHGILFRPLQWEPGPLEVSVENINYKSIFFFFLQSFVQISAKYILIMFHVKFMLLHVIVMPWSTRNRVSYCDPRSYFSGTPQQQA